MNFVATILTTFLFAGFWLHHPVLAYDEYGLGKNSKTKELPQIYTDTLTFESLKRIIQDEKIRSIEGLLNRLAQLDAFHQRYSVLQTTDLEGETRDTTHFTEGSQRSLFRNVALIFDSKSEHQSSTDAPRIVLYRPDAKLFLAYSGIPKDPAYYRLEVYQAPGITSLHGGLAIDFPRSDEEEVKFLDGTKGNKPKPTNCRTCHLGMPTKRFGEIFKPNIEAYAFWPGWVGTFESDGTADQAIKDKIIKQQRKNDRYRHLLPVLRSMSIRDDFGNKNTKLTQKLNKQQYEMGLRALREHPMFDALKLALLGATMACDVEAFFPESWKKGATPYKWFLKHLKLSNQKHFELLLRQHGRKLSEEERRKFNGDRVFRTPIARLSYVMENFMGLSMSRWSLSRRRNAFTFSDGVPQFVSFFLPELAKQCGLSQEEFDRLHPMNDDLKGFKPGDMEALIAAIFTPRDSKWCDDKAVRSRHALTKLKAPTRKLKQK